MQPVSVPDLTARQLHAVSLWLSTIASSLQLHFLKTSQPALTRAIMRVDDTSK
jgi:hypothetical protein